MMGRRRDQPVMTVDAALKALAHPGRRAMLRLVWDAELTASELAQRTGMTKPGASQHLRMLRDAGLVAPGCRESAAVSRRSGADARATRVP